MLYIQVPNLGTKGPCQYVDSENISIYNILVPIKWMGTWTLTTEHTFIRYGPVMWSKSGDNAKMPSGGAETPVKIGLLPSAIKHHSIMRLLYAAR